MCVHVANVSIYVYVLKHVFNVGTVPLDWPIFMLVHSPQCQCHVEHPLLSFSPRLLQDVARKTLSNRYFGP